MPTIQIARTSKHAGSPSSDDDESLRQTATSRVDKAQRTYVAAIDLQRRVKHLSTNFHDLKACEDLIKQSKTAVVEAAALRQSSDLSRARKVENALLIAVEKSAEATRIAVAASMEFRLLLGRQRQEFALIGSGVGLYLLICGIFGAFIATSPIAGFLKGIGIGAVAPIGILLLLLVVVGWIELEFGQGTKHLYRKTA